LVPYAWNENESQATARNGPLSRTGVRSEIGSSRTSRTNRRQLPPWPVTMGNTVYALRNARALRSYAISRESAVAFSATLGVRAKAFVLGFQAAANGPTKTRRRRCHRTNSLDELDQLKRFMDLGLITGISSLAALVPARGVARHALAPQQLRACRAKATFSAIALTATPERGPFARKPEPFQVCSTFSRVRREAYFQFAIDK